jgi:hypothetical protein
MNALEIEAVPEAERKLETSGRRYQRLDTIFPLDSQTLGIAQNWLLYKNPVFL